MDMDKLFQLMKEKKASDLFLSVNSPAQLKINGNMIPVNQQKMDSATIRTLLAEVVKPGQMKQLEKTSELNIAIPIVGLGSFRLSAFRQRGSLSAVFRYVACNIPGLAELHVPPALGDLILEKRGLVLVVGASGSGKSSTIAAMLEHRNTLKTGHILTLEDPIEFLFTNKRSIVNQREIGTDTENLKVALKNALRQAPDCILIGEIRDKETMSAAIAYAQSGHLVVATLHANNSYQALNRVINFFPTENRLALLPELAGTIRAIISQRLVMCLDGNRRPAVEILINTRHIAELIQQGEIAQVREAIEKSLSPGSQTFEQALLTMIQQGIVGQDEALAHADSPTNLYWLLTNSQPTSTGSVAPEPEVAGKATFTGFTLNK